MTADELKSRLEALENVALELRDALRDMVDVAEYQHMRRFEGREAPPLQDIDVDAARAALANAEKVL